MPGEIIFVIYRALSRAYFRLEIPAAKNKGRK
jgi:hypothetical protein